MRRSSKVGTGTQVWSETTVLPSRGRVTQVSSGSTVILSWTSKAWLRPSAISRRTAPEFGCRSIAAFLLQGRQHRAQFRNLLPQSGNIAVD